MREEGYFAQGLAYAEHGLELDPRLYACDLAAAQCSPRPGCYDDAIRRLETLSKIAPDDAGVQQELAQTLAQRRASSGK